MKGLKENLKSLAEELGFELFGISDAHHPELLGAVAHYKDWVVAGHATTMKYLERHIPKKENPDLFLTNAKSVIILGKSYAQLHPEQKTDLAKISIYSALPDYHKFFEERLEKLKLLVESHGESAEYFVDSKPVLERFWAKISGIGWVGKNTCIINRQYGSYIFLGGLLTTADLNSDLPYTDHCGKCTKCIEACPTQAIQVNIKNGKTWVESEKCIAYHTIENRGEIPQEVMDQKNNWIAGCDICQQVCPWNDPIKPIKPWGDVNPWMNSTLDELKSVTEAEFNEKMKPYPMFRMKFSGFLRNITN